MGLELSQLHSLLANPQGSVHFEHLPEAVASHLGSQLRIVYLSGRSLKHIMEEHKDVELFDVLHLPFMVRNGLWVADRPNQAQLFYKHPDNGKIYKAATKVTPDGYEVYISTLHRCSARQIRKALRDGVILSGKW